MLNLLENEVYLHYSGEGGGGSNPEDESKKELEKKDPPKNDDEKITLTKAEYEEKLKQKFAEGARKAQEGKLDDETKKDEKANKGENKGENDDGMLKEVTKIKDELATLRAEKLVTQMGVKPSYTEDLVALVRGKGLELNEENLKKEADKHPEWKASNEDSNGFRLGGLGGKANPPSSDEKEQAKKMFQN